MSLSQRRHFRVHSSILLNGGNTCSPLDCRSGVEYSLLISCSQSWWQFCPSRFICFFHMNCRHDCRVGGSRSFSFSWQLCLLAFNSSPKNLWQTVMEQWQSCIWEVDFELPRSFLHSSEHFDGQLVKKTVECLRFLLDHNFVDPSAHRKVQTSHRCHILHFLCKGQVDPWRTFSSETSFIFFIISTSPLHGAPIPCYRGFHNEFGRGHSSLVKVSGSVRS